MEVELEKQTFPGKAKQNQTPAFTHKWPERYLDLCCRSLTSTNSSVFPEGHQV